MDASNARVCGFVDLDERISAIITMDARSKSTIGVVSMNAWRHGGGRIETVLWLVIRDTPLEMRRDIL